MEKQLGKITSAIIGREDHGMMTFMLHFDFGGTGQGFGNYCLDTYDKAKDRRIGTAAGCDLILQLMEVFDVDDFSKIKGRYAYALRDNESFSAMIRGVETPPMDGGKRFHVADWCKEWGLK